MLIVKLSLFGGLVDKVANSDFYTEYLIKWPAPFNIVSFDAVLLCIMIFIFVRWLYHFIDGWHYAVRFRAKQQQLQEERLEFEIKQRERDKQRAEDDEMIRQYLKFMLTASAKNMIGTDQITLEQFKNALEASKHPDDAEETVYDAEPVAKAEPVTESEEDMEYEEEPQYEEEYNFDEKPVAEEDPDTETKDEPDVEVSDSEPPVYEADNEEQSIQVTSFADENDSETEEKEEAGTHNEPAESLKDVLSSIGTIAPPDSRKERALKIDKILKDNNLSDDGDNIKSAVADGPLMEENDFQRLMSQITKQQKVKDLAQDNAERQKKLYEDRSKKLDESLKKTIKNKDLKAPEKRTMTSSEEIDARKKEAARLRDAEIEKRRLEEEKQKNKKPFNPFKRGK